MNNHITIKEKDCTSFLALSSEDFVIAVYRELLEREPDNDGFIHNLRQVYKGMPREAIIYTIVSSPEFAGRFEIKYLEKYKKIYKKYIFNTKIKSIPVIGWCVKLIRRPDMRTILQDIRIDAYAGERSLQQKMDKMQAEIERVKSNTATLHEKTDNNIDWLRKVITELHEKTDIANANLISILEKADGNTEWFKKVIIELHEKTDINIDWLRKVITELHEKTDISNANLISILEKADGNTEWFKKVIIELHEKTDIANVNLTNTLENINKLPKTNEITAKFDKMNYLVNVQRIINKGMTATYGLENIQAELISLLNDKTNEFDSYNKLPIEHLVKYADGKTAAAAYYSQLISDYANKKNLPEIEAAGIEPATLPGICQGKDTLIVANPVLSALILTSPVLLREIAQKLNRNLVLSVRAMSSPISITWEGFSFIEHEEGKGTFRWAEGEQGIWRIFLFNAEKNPIEVEIQWFAESLCGTGELTATCYGNKTSAELKDHISFNLHAILQPGNNELILQFSGPVKSPGIMDPRILAFRIFNLSCIIEGIDILADSVNKDKNVLLSDNFIRRTLHRNGFYDVESIAYANHGFSKRVLEKTRFEYPFEYHIVTNAKKSAIESDEIVCYKACRLRQTDNL